MLKSDLTRRFLKMLKWLVREKEVEKRDVTTEDPLAALEEVGSGTYRHIYSVSR